MFFPGCGGMFLGEVSITFFFDVLSHPERYRSMYIYIYNIDISIFFIHPIFLSWLPSCRIEAETLRSLVELVDSLPDVVVRTWTCRRNGMGCGPQPELCLTIDRAAAKALELWWFLNVIAGGVSSLFLPQTYLVCLAIYFFLKHVIIIMIR